jgi:hypothetical protein
MIKMNKIINSIPGGLKNSKKEFSIAETWRDGNAEFHENQSLQNNFRLSIPPCFRD